MRFYTFGDEQNPVILLLPGTCCHWRANFGEVIPLLEKDLFVVCVSYDGFDETEQTVFPDMLTETTQIEQYIQKNFGGQICAAYGCSLGGSFVGLLVGRRNIHIDHAILGSSDLDQSGPFAAKLKTAIVAPMLYGMFQTGRSLRFMQKWLQGRPTEERHYYEKMLTMFGINSTRMAFVQKQSIANQFYSDLVTPLQKKIAVPGTTVHCFYAAKMGKRYLNRYKHHFRNPDILRHDLQHEELLFAYPEQWAQEIKECCLRKKGKCR